MNVLRSARLGIGSVISVALCSTTAVGSLFVAAFGTPAALLMFAVAVGGNAVVVAKLAGWMSRLTAEQTVTAGIGADSVSAVGLFLLIGV